MAVVPVISHDKERILRYHDGTEIVSGLNVSGEKSLIQVNGIVDLKEFTIDENLFVDNFNAVACHAHNPLNEIFFWIYWIFENDDVFTFGLANGNPGGAGEGIFYSVSELVNQEVVTDQQGGNHGSGWNFKRLDNE